MPKSAVKGAPSANAIPPTSPGRLEHQQDVINRLRRIEGQVKALTQMIEGGRSCEEVAQQMAAARKAMDRAFYRMMACTMLDSLASGAPRESLEKSTRILEKYS